VPARETVVIVDPPRDGCSPSFLEQLAAFSPRAVVYVSCNPLTQARDVAWLVARGFALEELVPFDMFPQTRHLESVACLRGPSGQLARPGSEGAPGATAASPASPADSASAT